jgi:hypothetical protein
MNQIRNATISYFDKEFLEIKVYTYVTNLFRGFGIAHCIDTKEYIQLPLPILFPSIFIGYKAYTYKNDIKKFILDNNK